ncbi:MAG: GTPase HflX [Bacillota bacterium]
MVKVLLSRSANPNDSLDELASLVSAAGAGIANRILQRRDKPDPAFYVGKGKAEEIRRECEEKECDLVVFDNELTPAQGRNLKDVIGVRVIDRTQVILDIFARRARTKEGKLQVELAQLNYLLPRLTGKGTELSRLGGGIGTRGPGETKLETDRRRIRKRIQDLTEALARVRKQRALLRQARKDVPLPLVALVGYTNAGKSTLMNALTGSEVFVQDMLFATLDPTTRRLRLSNNEVVLLTDTVGFVSSLPHHLVAAFRATLEEVTEADLLLHVADVSHPDVEKQIAAVDEVLASLGVLDKPTILVLNKIDRIPDAELIVADRPTVKVSAREGTNLDVLKEEIVKGLALRRVVRTYTVPYEDGQTLSLLHEKGDVLEKEYLEEGVKVIVSIPWSLSQRLPHLSIRR